LSKYGDVTFFPQNMATFAFYLFPKKSIVQFALGFFFFPFLKKIFFFFRHSAKIRPKTTH